MINKEGDQIIWLPSFTVLRVLLLKNFVEFCPEFWGNPKIILIMKSTVLFVQTSLFGVDSANEVTIGAERGLEHKNSTSQNLKET